jgi:xanthine dehydrogenase accessory factor
MGALVCDGSTSPLRGEPRPFGGVARERFVYAPQPGLFRACADIGMPVTAGEILGEIGAVPIRAPLAGHVRGICHSGAHVSTGTKVLEIDPRDGVVSWVGIGDRPRQVARGVLGALEAAA